LTLSNGTDEPARTLSGRKNNHLQSCDAEKALQDEILKATHSMKEMSRSVHAA
jgi:hypothetical protein